MSRLLKKITTILVLLGLSSAGLFYHYLTYARQFPQELNQHELALRQQEYRQADLDTRINNGLDLPDEHHGAVYYDAEMQTNIILSPSTGVTFD